jgi:hypothetical protein
MKTPISFIMIMMFMLFACNKDQFIREEPLMLKKANVQDHNLDLKEAKGSIPMKADFCSTPDLSIQNPFIFIEGTDPNDQKNYLPRKMFISGHGTHMGEVITKKSWFECTECDLLVEPDANGNMLPYIIQKGHGLMTAANRDNYKITAEIKTSLLSWTYIGEVKMFDGTGKFKGMTGTVAMKGVLDPVTGTNCWTGDGFMNYNHDKKDKQDRR